MTDFAWEINREMVHFVTCSMFQEYSSGLEDSIDEAVLVYSAAPDSQISDHTEVRPAVRLAESRASLE